jgi:hypothetical protein
MQRLRYHLGMLVLAIATIGPALLGLATGTTTAVRVRSHAPAIVSTADGQSATLIARTFQPPCSVPGNDC